MPAEKLGESGQKKKIIHKERFFLKKKNQIREEVRHIRLKESPYTAQRAVGNHQRIDRPILKITPRIDQRIHGVPNFQVEQDPTRTGIIANLTCQALQSSKNKR